MRNRDHTDESYPHSSSQLDECEFTNVYINHKPASFDFKGEFEKIGEIESLKDDGSFGFVITAFSKTKDTRILYAMATHEKR